MTKTKLRVLPLILFLGVMLTHNANAEVNQHLCEKVKTSYNSYLIRYDDDDAAKKADMLAHHLFMLGCINE